MDQIKDYFFNSEIKKEPSLYEIFKKVHVLSFSQENLRNLIQNYEQNKSRSYLPMLSEMDRLIHMDLNMDCKTKFDRIIKNFQRNLKELKEIEKE